MDLKKIYQENIDVFGAPTEIVKAVEEMSELTQLLCKALAGDLRFPQLADELADVRIMMDQVTIILEHEHPGFLKDVNQAMMDKLQRQVKRIYEKKRQNSK